MESRLVSVIIPVYNVKEYLKKCIFSVIEQSYRNLEIILVDDGSTDGSESICDLFALEDNRIKVIHKENGGLGLARNAGIKVANGEYIYFIDSDDYVNKDAINNLMFNIEKYNCDTVIGGFTRVNENDVKLYSKKNSSLTFVNSEVKNRLLPRLIGSAVSQHDSIRMSVWNVIYSTKIIKENSIKFVSERAYLSEDVIWDIDYFNFAKKVKIIDKEDYFYRKHQGTLTTKKFSYKKRLESIKKLYFLEQRKLEQRNLLAISEERLEREFFINLSSCFRIIVQDNKFMQAVDEIKNLMNDDLVCTIIKKYPYKRAGIKIHLYLGLIANKQTLLMYFLSKIRN